MWQPRETAPKDGTWLLVIVKDSPMLWAPYELACWQSNSEYTYYGTDGEFHKNEKGYFGGTDTSDEIEFTHWMQLPAPPVIEKASGIMPSQSGFPNLGPFGQIID